MGPYEDKKHPVSEWVKLFVTKAFYYTYAIILPLVTLNITWWQVLIGFTTLHLIAGLILGIIFQLAHVVESTTHPIPNKDNMIENMQSGSVIYDLAAIQGGNTAFTEVDKIIEKNGIKIMGESNILNKLPVSASNLYAKNVFNFVDNLMDKDKRELNINLEDEIIEKTLIK